MGKQYTEQEKQRIQELAEQGHTDESIAHQLGRSTNAIRNYRHRTNITTKETINIEQLKQEKQKLSQKNGELEKQMKQLETRRNQVGQALRIEETQLTQKLEAELVQLKNVRPELFEITGQEQLAKLTTQLGLSLLRWVFE